MEINNDILVLDEMKVSQTYENREDIQKPSGGLVEQVIREDFGDEPSRKKVLVLRGDDVIRIDACPFIIGKSTQADFTIENDTYISRKHCRITRRGETYSIEDLQSLNGTFVNGEEITGKVELKEGMEVTIADREYRVRWED